MKQLEYGIAVLAVLGAICGFCYWNIENDKEKALQNAGPISIPLHSDIWEIEASSPEAASDELKKLQRLTYGAKTLDLIGTLDAPHKRVYQLFRVQDIVTGTTPAPK